MVITNGWSSFTLTKDRKDVFFKKVNYRLKPAFCRANSNIDSIWIYTNPIFQPEPALGNWEFVEGKGLGEHDVNRIADWPSVVTIDEIKAYNIERDYSGFLLLKPGHLGKGGGCFFKKFPHQLTPA